MPGSLFSLKASPGSGGLPKHSGCRQLWICVITLWLHNKKSGAAGRLVLPPRRRYDPTTDFPNKTKNVVGKGWFQAAVFVCDYCSAPCRQGALAYCFCGWLWAAFGLLLASCFGCFVDVLDCVGGSFFNVV